MQEPDTPHFSHACKLAFAVACLLTSCQSVDAQRSSMSFERQVIDQDFAGGYGVELADINGDSRLDIVALSTSPAQLVWFKNPSWERHTISSLSTGYIDAAPNDIDGDGDIDLVLASDFSLSDSNSGGTVEWLENPGQPEESSQWVHHAIDQVPTTHRLQWGDINGDGKDELVSLPIVGIGAQAPEYDVNVALRAYAVPRNLSVRRWPSVVLDESLQMSHGLLIEDWDGDGREDILTASFYGVHLFQLAKRNQAVAKQYLAMGNQENERPAIGSSEVGIGRLRRPILGDSASLDSRFIATIEPWHGSEVVVYRSGRNSDALWSRTVIADDIAGGHALAVADFDNDGVDEIVAGGRSEPHKLSLYRYDSDAELWRASDIDAGGVAASGIAIADLNGDGFNDIVAIGSSTRNVVYYQNRGQNSGN